MSSQESFEEFLLHVQMRYLQEDELLGGWEPEVSRHIICHCAFFIFNKTRVECRMEITSCAFNLEVRGVFLAAMPSALLMS